MPALHIYNINVENTLSPHLTKGIFICMKKLLCILSAFILCFCFCSCDSSPSPDKISATLDLLSSDIGGNVIIYHKGTNCKDENAIISLYGRGSLPDELSLVDYAAIWYSDRMVCGDLAVFYAVNATDTPSIEKMCNRRANTLKAVAGTGMTVISHGHYVLAYTTGIPEIEQAAKSLIDSVGA